MSETNIEKEILKAELTTFILNRKIEINERLKDLNAEKVEATAVERQAAFVGITVRLIECDAFLKKVNSL